MNWGMRTGHLLSVDYKQGGEGIILDFPTGKKTMNDRSQDTKLKSLRKQISENPEKKQPISKPQIRMIKKFGRH